jgi:hypothetical protein
MDPLDYFDTFGCCFPPQAFKDIPYSLTFPTLRGISTLTVKWRTHHNNAPRNLHPTWLFKLIAACPSVATVNWELFEPKIPEAAAVESSQRQLLASALSNPILQNLRSLELDFMIRPVGQNSYQYEAATDSLNPVLRTLPQQLRKLALCGSFSLSPSLFWPDTDSPGNSNQDPSWPLLETARPTALQQKELHIGTLLAGSRKLTGIKLCGFLQPDRKCITS